VCWSMVVHRPYAPGRFYAIRVWTVKLSRSSLNHVLVQLCIALEITPSELLELAGVWSPKTPGHAGPDDLRLRHAFAEIGALPMDGKQWAVSLVASLATALGNMDEQRTDDDPGREPAPARGI